MPTPIGNKRDSDGNRDPFLDWFDALEAYAVKVQRIVVGLDSDPVLSTGFRLGDANLDGRTNITDGVAVLRIAAGVRSAADYNAIQFQHFYQALTGYFQNELTNDTIQIGPNYPDGSNPPRQSIRDDPYPTHGNDAINASFIADEHVLRSGGFSISEAYGVDQQAGNPYNPPTSGTISYSDLYRTSGPYLYVGGRDFSVADKQRNGYTEFNTSISAFKGTGLYRFYICYRNGTAGTSFRGDFQIDQFRLQDIGGSNVGTTYGFESNADGWSTLRWDTDNSENFPGRSLTGIDDAVNATWVNVGTGTSLYRWNRDRDTTPSSGTGVNDGSSGQYFLYAETSGSNTLGARYWLRSPIFDSNIEFRRLAFDWAVYGDTNNRGQLDIWMEKVPAVDPDLTYAPFNSSSVRRIRVTPRGGPIPHNSEVRVTWAFRVGTSGTSFQNDLQIQNPQLLGADGRVFRSFAGLGSIWNGSIWQTINSNTNRQVRTLEEADPLFFNMADGFNSTQYQWNKDANGTPSGGTGVNTGDIYVYAETSGTSAIVQGNTYWVRTHWQTTGSSGSFQNRGTYFIQFEQYSSGSGFNSTNDEVRVFIERR